MGFLDGAKVIKVRMYEGAAETWQEWGRSLDLKDASSPAQLWGDLWLLLMVQGLPFTALVSLWGCYLLGYAFPTAMAAAGLNTMEARCRVCAIPLSFMSVFFLSLFILSSL